MADHTEAQAQAQDGAAQSPNSTAEPPPIKKAPGAWKCKFTVYIMSFWSTPSSPDAKPPAVAYSPLEAGAPFATAAESGRWVGGLHNFMAVRYSETPVGPYDELLFAPGAFEYDVPASKDGKRKAGKRRNMRITRIYVSQRDTCWNGRYNWNIPKHLARFEWTDLPGGAKQLRVFPHDVGPDVDPTESRPGVSPASDAPPFFQMSFKPVPLLPPFPMSSRLTRYLGMDLDLAMPPLPQGGSEELVGTDRWCKAEISMFSWRSRLGWFDMQQPATSKAAGGDDGEGGENGEAAPEGPFPNFWPGLGRWVLGVRMEDADFGISEGEHWLPLPAAGGSEGPGGAEGS